MRIRVLDFLRDDFPDRRPGDERQVEYRLVCSGTLHRDIVGDWAKSNAAQVLSADRFDLIVVDLPLDHYPQELALRFGCPVVHEIYGDTTFSHVPDNEIVADFSALLTLFARRLVLVAGKVREIYVDRENTLPPALHDFPRPIRDATFSYWPPRPTSITVTPERVDGKWQVRQEVRQYEPLPVPIRPEALTQFLESIARQEDRLATRIVAAARRYQASMRFITEDPDLTYQMLVSAIETLSNTVLSGHVPPLDRMMASRGDLVDHLRRLGLTAPQIEQTVLLVNKSMSWSQWRFVRFIEDNLPGDNWTDVDPLYPNMNFFDLYPRREDLGNALAEIYRQRSASSHAGRPYPAYVSIGTSPWITNEAFRALRAAAESDRLPPLTWFERAVQASLHHFISTL